MWRWLCEILLLFALGMATAIGVAWAYAGIDHQDLVAVGLSSHNYSPATVGNGVMVALAMESKQEVDAIHKKALELGALDEGAPGPRGDQFYAGYFRDLDGNKLNAYFIG